LSCKHQQKISKSNESKGKSENVNVSLKQKYAEKLGVSASDIKNEN
jgi:hypothetical protein